MLLNFAKITSNQAIRTLCQQKPNLLTRNAVNKASAFYSTEVKNLPNDFEIPEPPAPAENVEMGIVNDEGEVAFALLNLGGWSPVGMAESAMEFLHISCGLPWWGTIIAGTVFVRSVTMPFAIMAQKNMTNMSKFLPEIQRLQLKITSARQRGDLVETSQASTELFLIMKDNNIKPTKGILAPLVQVPFFVSFFLALRQMTSLPVESMRHGGLYWFSDLTIPDPYFILPMMTSLTVLTTIELSMNQQLPLGSNSGIMKYIMRVLPFAMLPFVIKFPAGILCYWVSTNIFSLVQSIILRRNPVRRFLKLGELTHHDPNKLPLKSKGFIKEVKDSYNNIKVAKKVADIQQADVHAFKSAGIGPIIKTYKEDPTKMSKLH